MLENTFEPLLDYALYLVFPLIVAPFAFLAFYFKVFPTRRVIFTWFGVGVCSCLAFFTDENSVLFWLTVIVDIVVVLLFLVDVVLFLFSWAAITWKGNKIFVSREAERIASLGQPLDVTLRVENRSDRSISLELVDDVSPDSEVLPGLDKNDFREIDKQETRLDSFRVERRTLAPHTIETFSYRLIWNRRGVFAFEFVTIRTTSLLGFWRRYKKIPVRSVFQVYPNLCQLAQFKMLARASRLHLLGVRRTRRVGQDAEFERLRDYTLDDQYKFIDWKATARHNNLIVRDFQTTRNQRIVLALDSGRMMMNRSNGVTFFDAALNSMLALAYIALKQGDDVGFLIFSNDVRRFVAPRGGMSQMNALIRSVFDVFPERVESRYDRAFSYLESRSSKRSLVVLATNVLDERNAEQVEGVLSNLQRSHLPLGLFLRDHALFDVVDLYNARLSNSDDSKSLSASRENSYLKNRLALLLEQFKDDREPADEIDRLLYERTNLNELNSRELLFRSGVAADILNWRRRVVRNVVAKGVLTLDVFPEDLTAPLINKYLEIKARRLL